MMRSGDEVKQLAIDRATDIILDEIRDTSLEMEKKTNE